MDHDRELMKGFARQAVRIGAAWPLFGVRGFDEDEVHIVEETPTLPTPSRPSRSAREDSAIVEQA